VKLAGLAFVLAAGCGYAQQSQIGADFEHEGERFRSSCLAFTGFGSVGGCAQVLFTDHPLHIAVGSLAPGNGFAAGPAFVGHWTPNETWRLSWDADAVASSNGSWRAGGYLTAVLIRRPTITVTGGGSGSSSSGEETEQPVFHAYVQNTSLNQIAYFGLGEDTTANARSFFGESEAIVGTNIVWPLGSALQLAAFGEVNGRFVGIRARNGESSPSIEQTYNDSTAPGLAHQPGTAQFGEGLRATPSFGNGHVRLNYSVTFQQFASGDSRFSFRRLITDLDHEFPIYRISAADARQFNGPDDCAAGTSDPKCPAASRNLEGSFGVRLMMTQSFVPGGHAVPFYFAPTIGGSDIDGNPALASYPDYRFRGPDAIVVRWSFEHSIYKWPVGVALMADEGKVAMRPGDLGLNHLAHSYSAGLTLRAGGFPAMYLLFAWGGHEGYHTIARIDTSLLGATARPALY
jgi:hypothetical protein